MSRYDEHDEDARIARQLRDVYNVPPETPRAPMWTAIASEIGAADLAGRTSADVIDLAAVRRDVAQRDRERAHRPFGWAVAAAAVLVLGIGIGRMSAPTEVGEGAVATRPATSGPSGYTLAAREHLGRTESLLTMVRADVRDGRVHPSTSEWATGLLTQTRLLIDAEPSSDPEVADLLLDLELVLIQIAGVGQSGSMGEERARTELDLAIRSLEEGELLPRIQAALPPAMEGV